MKDSAKILLLTNSSKWTTFQLLQWTTFRLVFTANTFYYHDQPLTLHPFECYVAFDRAATPALNARMFSIRYVPTNNATLPYLTPDNLLMQYYDNHLHLQPNGLPISVYTINGTLLFYSNGETSTIAIPLHSGCYLLRYANQTHKIIL